MINFPIKIKDKEINDINGVKPINLSEFLYIFKNIDKENVQCEFPVIPKLGYMTKDEIYVLNLMIKFMKPKKVFEFGTFDGFSGKNIILNNKETLKIFSTLDILEKQSEESKYYIDNTNLPMIFNLEKGKHLTGLEKITNVEMILCDSAKFDTESYKDKYDVVLVDACHTYEYVMNDTNKAYEICRKGGLIIWHDYNKNRYMPGVTTALNEFSIKNKKDLYWISDINCSDYNTSLVFTIKT